MPKVTKYPGLYSRTRKGVNGKLRCYYFLDRRAEGLPELSLGKDYDEAVRLWDEHKNKRPRIKGTLEEAFQKWEEEVLPGYENPGTKRNYALSLKRLREVFAQATWDATKLHHLKAYLKARSAKRQANHEMSLLSIIWNYARTEGLTELPWPAAGMEKARWRNRESARTFSVSDAMFAAVYAFGDQTLKAVMDLSTATGLRLTDCLRCLCPAPGEPIQVKASKTGKSATFSVVESPVLSRLVESRRAQKADHLMLLTTPQGKPVTQQMLRTRYEKARETAAKKAEEAGDTELAKQIRAMFLRDCRKRAADLAGSLEEASKLLQHGDQRTTRVHYRGAAERLKPVR